MSENQTEKKEVNTISDATIKLANNEELSFGCAFNKLFAKLGGLENKLDKVITKLSEKPKEDDSDTDTDELDNEAESVQCSRQTLR